MFTQKRTFKSKITQKSCSKSLLQKNYFSKGSKKGFLEVDSLKKVLKKVDPKKCSKNFTQKSKLNKVLKT